MASLSYRFTRYIKQGNSLLNTRVQELCESRGGRPGLTVLMSPMVSVDVKQHWTMHTHWSQFVPNMSTRHPRTLSSTSSSSIEHSHLAINHLQAVVLVSNAIETKGCSAWWSRGDAYMQCFQLKQTEWGVSLETEGDLTQSDWPPSRISSVGCLIIMCYVDV